MKTRMKLTAITLLFLIIAPGTDSSTYANDGKIASPLQKRLAQTRGTDSLTVWVYFTDKTGPALSANKALNRFSEKAQQRRTDIPADSLDIPVDKAYIDAVTDAGGADVRPSRWLNAVSARIQSSDISTIERLPFVRKIDIVKTYTRRPEPQSARKPLVMPPPEAADYGQSYTQNTMLKADSAHSIGLDGTGILIAFLDTGYDTAHTAFDSMDIVATYDFINGDSDVTDSIPTFSQTNHGTATLSACGGYDPGFLIGTAYGASYLLAKTEDVSDEYQAEENNWVFGMEWADSAGADIISSSLGYTDWYTTIDMDGNTATTTIAADIAASRGILVVTSAGNEGNDPWRIISAPADADSIVSVGAVDPSGNPTSFTSYGPTADGRMKPEVVALGSGTYCANDGGGYYVKSGTSLATPLIAGCAALIMQANPSLRGNPIAVRQRLMESGHLYPLPDPGNRLGFGIPDVIKASKLLSIAAVPVLYIHPGQDTIITIVSTSTDSLSVSFSVSGLPASYSLVNNGDGTADLFITGDASQEGAREFVITATNGSVTAAATVTIVTIIDSFELFVGPNPFSESLTIRLQQDIPARYEIRIYALSGEKVFETSGADAVVDWPGTNQNGEKVASGVYIIYVSADGIEEKVKVFKL